MSNQTHDLPNIDEGLLQKTSIAQLTHYTPSIRTRAVSEDRINPV